MAETYPAYLEAYEERPRRRGRRLLVTLVVLLLVLGGLFVAADRVAANAAEQAIADQVRQEAAKQDAQTAQPRVSIGGFPFLTQVLAGRYESISIVMRDVRGAVQGNSLSLPELAVEARNVRAPLDTLRSGKGEVTAETVDGTATIGYDSVARLIDRPGLKLAEQDGKLVMTAPIEVLGKQLTVNGTADLSVAKGQVRIRFDTLTAEGLPQIPAAQALLNTYAKQISVNVDLPDLPFNLDVQQARPRPEGLAVTATAKNVPLNSVA